MDFSKLKTGQYGELILIMENLKADWFTRARFGMFIHWGLYSMPARHEWIRHIEKISQEDYKKYFELFDPDLFNPKEWAKMAREAGMKYIVITTKHHDGFCLWNSKLTDFSAVKAPECKRDLLREIVDAFRAEGLNIGFYYSIADWHHPEFPIDKIHPDRIDPVEQNKKRDISKYNKYMSGQIRELLTNYGKIDILWFDGCFPVEQEDGSDHWDAANLAKMIRSLQPGILINERLAKRMTFTPYEIDIKTPEQKPPEKGIRDDNGNLVVWEGCQTLSGAWGYFRDELTWKSVEDLVIMLIQHVSRGGNMLLNVGPTSRGEFDYRAQERFEGLAAWMKYHGRSIHGCTVSPEWAKEPENCRYTYNPAANRLYVHCLVWPYSLLRLPGLAGKIKYAQLLSDCSEIKFIEEEDDVVLKLHGRTELSSMLRVPRPVMMRPNVTVPVIELILN